MKRNFFFLLLALVSGMFYTSCDDGESYADKREREDKQIKSFLKTGAQVKDSDSGDYLLNIPGNIRVISEEEFHRNDSTTDVEKNEYVFFRRKGVYMQIVDKGGGEKIANGESLRVVARYTEFNIASDTIQSSNCITSYEMIPDIMTCSNTEGIFTASFLQGAMYKTYNSAAVPAGWLVPFTYINLGRLDSPTATLAHVRLIVPASQGQASAAANVYPCFYEIKYQRGL